MLLLTALAAFAVAVHIIEAESHDYCIVGAGPSGLQMAHFLTEAKRDFVVFERNNVSGSFFVKFPRHRTLISTNKRYTGSSNCEFNLRHDWNSLITHTSNLAFTSYSKEYFPPADAYVQYLEDYRRIHNINVRYNTHISDIRATDKTGCRFAMQDQQGTHFCCKTLLLGTGTGLAVVPNIQGSELLTSYNDMSVDPEAYAGKSVMILGRGNSGLETAKGLYGAANFVHLVARSRVKLSWETHYVGDIRGVNNEVLDAYMLKSLDGVFEASSEEMRVERRPGDGRLMLLSHEYDAINYEDSNPTRDAYDAIISCVGFKWDPSPFQNGSCPRNATVEGREQPKYPSMGEDFQSDEFPGLFFLGTLTHALDWRKSAGGFIHGYRYNARALHRLLEYRNHLRRWPAEMKPLSQLAASLLKRANEASGIYQMFQFLGDLAIIDRDSGQFTYLEEFPLRLIPQLTAVTGHNFVEGRHELLVLSLEYGANFSRAGEDHFGDERANGNLEEAHTCNFLHPVFNLYRRIPTQAAFDSRPLRHYLPKGDAIHHTIEDFTTLFNGPTTHLLPLRRFLEFILDRDLRVYQGDSCAQMLFNTGVSGIPSFCDQFLHTQNSVEAFAQ